MAISIELPTKSYVRHFIISNYGDPADFSIDKEINDRFRTCLSHPSRRENARYEELSFARYSTITRVVITEDDFYRYGFELTRTDIVAFGKFMERRAKFMMRNLVSYYCTYMMERDAILEFQSRFGFTEDIWSFESIKKDFYRSKTNDLTDITKELSVKIEKILLANLSKMGTISHKAFSNYDRIGKTA